MKHLPLNQELRSSRSGSFEQMLEISPLLSWISSMKWLSTLTQSHSNHTWAAFSNHFELEFSLKFGLSKHVEAAFHRSHRCVRLLHVLRCHHIGNTISDRACTLPYHWALELWSYPHSDLSSCFSSMIFGLNLDFQPQNVTYFRIKSPS